MFALCLSPWSCLAGCDCTAEEDDYGGGYHHPSQQPPGGGDGDSDEEPKPIYRPSEDRLQFNLSVSSLSLSPSLFQELFSCYSLCCLSLIFIEIYTSSSPLFLFSLIFLAVCHYTPLLSFSLLRSVSLPFFYLLFVCLHHLLLCIPCSFLSASQMVLLFLVTIISSLPPSLLPSSPGLKPKFSDLMTLKTVAGDEVTISWWLFKFALVCAQIFCYLWNSTTYNCVP